MAALHPLDFDPDDKLSFSAGIGHYKDSTAAAIGAFYQPNDDTLFSIGGTIGNGDLASIATSPVPKRPWRRKS